MGKIVQQIILLLGLIVLGRLLAPEEFGLFGLVLAATAFVLPIMDMGLQSAFIKTETPTAHTARAFHTINIGLGVAVGLGIAAAGPMLADHYGHAELSPLSMAYGLSLFLISLSQQPMAQLARAKRFKELFWVKNSMLLAGFIAAAVFGWAGAGVWALVARSIVQALTRLCAVLPLGVMTFRLASPTSLKSVADSVRFGGEIVVCRILSSSLLSLDRLLFSSFFGVSAMGQYNRSLQVAQAPDSMVRQGLSLPALAHIARKKGQEKNRAYELFFFFTFAIAGAACICVAVTGDRLIPLIMGDQWHMAGSFAGALGIWGIGKVLSGTATTLHINEQRVKRLMGLNVLAIPLTLAYPLLQLYKGAEPQQYLLVYGAGYTLYWTVSLLVAVYRINNKRCMALSAARSMACSFLVPLVVSKIWQAQTTPLPENAGLTGVVASIVLECTLVVTAVCTANIFGNIKVAKTAYAHVMRQKVQ